MTEKESARLIAERFIDFQPRTSAEVRTRLLRGGCDEEIVAEIVDDLERAGLLDDSRFSAEWVESRASRRGIGPVRLSAELWRKGISKDQIDAAVGALDSESQLAAALEVARKRLRTLDAGDPAARRKLATHLQRRGYTWDSVEQVFAVLFPNSE